MRGLLNAVQRCCDESTSTKAYLYLRVLDLLSTVTQENYPYHIDKVICIIQPLLLYSSASVLFFYLYR